MDINTKVWWDAFLYGIQYDNVDLVNKITENRNLIDHENHNKITPLLFAIESNSPNIVAILLNKGANPNYETSDGRFTPLLMAVKKRNYNIIGKLLEKGANPSQGLQMGGMTPIAWSVYTSDIEMISLFIKAGINLNQQDSNGDTPLTIAIIRQNDRGQEPFLTYQFLIENGADTNLENGKGQTPLSLAVMNNRYDIVTYLVSKGVDINKTSGLVEGLTPLFIAIRNNNFEISKFLIENGADVNKSESRHGNYPVNYAIHNADFEMIELLLDSGANLNVKNTTGYTPCHFAIILGNIDIIRFLVSRGMDCSIAADNNEKPFDMAVQNLNLSVNQREQNKWKSILDLLISSPPTPGFNYGFQNGVKYALEYLSK